MTSRGRPPAKSDASAISALNEIKKFIEINDINPSQLAHLVGVAPGTVIRVLRRDPPAWTDGFKKIVNYVKEYKIEDAGLIELTRTLQGNKDVAHATATLLRAVATLLERS